MHKKFLFAATLLMGLLPAMASASIRWKGDFSTGDLTQWNELQEVSSDRLQVLPADKNPSGAPYMMKTLVVQGDNPINASGNRNEVVNPTYSYEGQESYYRWQTKFDASFPSENTWQLFTQWHQKADCCGSPPIQFYVQGEKVILTESTAEKVVWTTPLVRGKWHDFVLHVKFSDDGSVGFLELWYDGQHVMDKTYGVTMATDYLKMGLYRSSTVSENGIVFHTGMVQGDSYEDVVPPAPPPVTPTSTTPSTPATTPDNGTPVATSTQTNAGLGSDSSNGPVAGGCSSTGAPLAAAWLGLVGLALIARRKRRQ
jgi:uncharacterized protein (TIGR03382 family)